MEYRTLDLTVVSAKDLKSVNLFSKMDVYAVVSISGDSRTQKKTNVDRSGHKNPTWNFPMKFTIDEKLAHQNNFQISIQIRCERALGDKVIGEVHVPIRELLDAVRNEKEVEKIQFVSYQVRRPSGKPKGVLNLSYKFSEKFAPADTQRVDSVPMAEPVTAYPAPFASTSSPYPPPHPPHYGAYPPPAGVGHASPYPAAASAYGGYPPPPPPGYYGYAPPQQQPARKNNFGMGLGAGLLGGAVGGMLIGDMVSDAGAYDAGFDDGGGFDF